MERWRRWSDSNVLMLFKLKDKTEAGDLAPMSEAAVALSLHLKALDWKPHLVSFDRSLPPPNHNFVWSISLNCLSVCVSLHESFNWSALISVSPPQSKLHLVNLSELSIYLYLSPESFNCSLNLSPWKLHFVNLSGLSICIYLSPSKASIDLTLSPSKRHLVCLFCLSSLPSKPLYHIMWVFDKQIRVWGLGFSFDLV